MLARRLSLALALFAIGTPIVSFAHAADDADIAVAHVGDVTIKASALKKAIGGVPSFEARSLGKDGPAVLRKYLDDVMIREELLAEAARRRHALDDRSVQLHLTKALSTAVSRRAAELLGGKETITDDDVKAYYDAHADSYKTPERVRVAHILLATEDDAKKAIARAKSDPTREGWPKLVTELSLDSNTKRSQGDLGFVTVDGKTTAQRVTVPKEVAAAAFAMKDGDIDPVPVKSDAGWHVIWRRGSTPASVRLLTVEAGPIRQVLFEQRKQKSYQALVEKVRADAKVETHEDLLPLVKIDSGRRAVPHASPSGQAPTPQPLQPATPSK